MSGRKYCIALVLWMFSLGILHSQENRTEMYINFRVGSSVIDTSYLDNAARIDEIVYYLQSIHLDPNLELLEVAFCGAASPEGSDQLNTNLARERLSALEEFVCNEVYIPEEIITRNDRYIPWDYLRSRIETSDLEYREEILDILDEEPVMVDHHYPNRQVDHRVLKLKELDRGSAWIDMYQLFFEDMRNAHVVFVTREYSSYQEPVPDVDSVSEQIEEDYDAEDEYEYVPPKRKKIKMGGGGRVFSEAYTDNKLYLKTNAAGLALGMSNLAVELDVADHLSLVLPVYYSAWNYFKSTLKFRCLLFQPELRYWVDEHKTGFFAGAHLGVSSYNFAFDGDYRFQDHDGITPAFGAGVSLGYRIPISTDRRWQVEFSLGAGAYALHFDMFNNTSDVKKGELVSTHRMTHVGLDQAQVTFSYSFDLKRKEGGR